MAKSWRSTGASERLRSFARAHTGDDGRNADISGDGDLDGGSDAGVQLRCVHLGGSARPATAALGAAALGEWCQGFLHGFGVNAGGLELSTDAKEVLQDLAAISQVQDALEESEDGEGDYMEVMEYLRVAPLLLFTETRKSAEPVAAKPSLH